MNNILRTILIPATLIVASAAATAGTLNIASPVLHHEFRGKGRPWRVTILW